MKRKERKLTRLILGALMVTSGALIAPGVASADDPVNGGCTAAGTTTSYYFTQDNTTLTISDGAIVPNVDLKGHKGCKIVMLGSGQVSTKIMSTVAGAEVTVEGGTVNSLFGAHMTGDGVEASGNKVIVKNSTITNLTGGYSEGANADANNNEVTVENGTIGTSGIRGGNSQNKNAKENKVTINGAATMINGSVIGGDANYGDAVDNRVDFNDGKITSSNIYGGYGTNGGNVTDNIVNVSGGTIAGGGVYGGNSLDGNATGNIVNINGGTIGTAGEWTSIVGGSTGGDGKTASGNTVTIDDDVTFLGDVGLYAGQATGNAGIATNNTLNILTKIAVAELMGGDVRLGGTSSGNTLNVAAKEVSTRALYGFQNINFFLPDGAVGKTMLTVNGGEPTDLKGVAIGAAVQAGASLVKGDAVNLITNPNGLTTDSTTTMKQITDETVTIQTKPTPKTLTTDQSYTLEVSQKDDTTIIATITDVEEKKRDDPDNPDNPSGNLQEKTKSLVETRAAATTYVNAGADMLASQGFMQAANAVALDAAEAAKNGTGAQNVGGFTPFAAFGGSSMRAESGSHVDTKGFGLNIGFARELPNSQGKLLFGPVVEYGGGSYDSHLDDGTRGEGGAHYFGVGLMARQVNHNGFYYEGSVRGGRVTSDYESNDVVTGAKVGYDSSSNYWAAHLGVGKAMNVGGNNTVDAYLKYFYSHQSGDDVAIKINGNETGDRGNFDSVDSNRIRIGARLTHKINDMNSIYGGLAYQYEFGGEARAHFTGVGETPSPSVKGSSGMLELGWQVKPGGPVTIDLGVTGWAGKQRGGSVQLGATWTF